MKKIIPVLFVLIVGLFLVLPSGKTEGSSNSVELKATVKTQQQVTLNWKYKSAKQFTVYRALWTEDGYVKEQKIATLSGSEKSFVDRKVKQNQYYLYTVKAYKSTKKKAKPANTGDVEVHTGWDTPEWNENVGSDYPHLKLYFNISDTVSLKHVGYEIYRRDAGAKSYEKIATIETKKHSASYTDKKVKLGASYDYKVRSFNKKQYSPFSEKITLSVLSRVGEYSAEVITKSEKQISELVILLKSKKTNGDLKLSKDALYTSYWLGNEEKESYLCAEEYSTDGTTWKPISEKKGYVLKRNQSVYLKFTSESGKPFAYPTEKQIKKENDRLWTEQCGYNGYSANFTILLSSKWGNAEPVTD